MKDFKKHEKRCLNFTVSSDRYHYGQTTLEKTLKRGRCEEEEKEREAKKRPAFEKAIPQKRAAEKEEREGGRVHYRLSPLLLPQYTFGFTLAPIPE